MKELPKINQDSRLQGKETSQKPIVDVLRLQVAEGQEKQQRNQNILAVTEKSFNQSAQRVDALVNWNIARPPARARSVVTIHHRIMATERLKIDLEDHTELLQNERTYLYDETQKLTSHKYLPQEDYIRLQSEIEGIGDHSAKKSLLQDVHAQSSVQQQDAQKTIKLLEHAASQIEKIDAYAEMTTRVLKEATEEHTHLEQQRPPGHLYFQEEDMHPAQAKIEFIPKGRFPGGCVVNMVRTLLKAQDVDVTDERHVAQTLGLHPLGGVDVRELHTTLPALGDQKGYQFWRIDHKYLDIVIKHGPLGAFLHTPHIGSHAVTLDHLEWDTLHQPHVVVLDQLRTEPYRIRIDTFIQAWSGGGALLPRSALRSYLFATMEES